MSKRLLKLKARVLEHGDVLRDLIHDASAPVDDQLRRLARQTLWLLACAPAVVILGGCLIWWEVT